VVKRQGGGELENPGKQLKEAQGVVKAVGELEE
jgi:hypothetical protein